MQLVMDGIAFPVALLVLAYVLRSLRLLIIPIINMIVSILTAFMIALPIAMHMVGAFSACDAQLSHPDILGICLLRHKSDDEYHHCYVHRLQSLHPQPVRYVLHSF